MLTHYCFHLGREMELSLAELKAFFGQGLERHGDVGVMDKKEKEWKILDHNPQEVLDQLGGCLKISRAQKTLAIDILPEQLAEQITQFLEEQKPEGKLSFGLNLAPQHDQFLNNLLKKIKEKLKTSGRNARFVNKLGNLNTAIIVKSGLMKHGTDLNLIKTDSAIFLTQTVAIQNANLYSPRDYEKPARLAKEGMLPPKLAQLMINLALSVENSSKENETFEFKGKTLYDPFCGSGTVLGEALIKGMDIIGSDIDPKAIEAAAANLKWLEQKRFSTPDQKKTLFIQDATTLSAKDLPTPPDLIVSETYLGPPQSKRLSEDEILTIYHQLEQLYLKFFEHLRPLLKAETPLVMAFPLYHAGKKAIRLPNLIDKLIPLRYKLNQSLVYRRSDQIVGREILVLETT